MIFLLFICLMVMVATVACQICSPRGIHSKCRPLNACTSLVAGLLSSGQCVVTFFLLQLQLVSSTFSNCIVFVFRDGVEMRRKGIVMVSVVLPAAKI
jgi:hypothetical protein